MSLLGIDVGTTGCKSAVFSEDGRLLGLAYQEYDHNSPEPGWAELDSADVWEKTKSTILKVTQTDGMDPIKALAVTSLGEAVVPVTRQREILGPSILNYDIRGQQEARGLSTILSNDKAYPITGVNFGNLFSMTKIMWVKKHQPEIYDKADFFLPWSAFISFMLGAEPVVDYSAASRTFLFDIHKETWSDEMLAVSGLDRQKLPQTAQAGMVIGKVSESIAAELHLPKGLPIVIGAHDQCANAVGSGVINDGQVMLGMGTFTCAVPVFPRRHDPARAIQLGMNTEHHAVPGHFVSFIYNQGGSVVKWFRNTFAGDEAACCQERGEDIYGQLFAEMPSEPTSMVFLPYFSITGLPELTGETSGVMSGLRLTTNRGEILKGIIESIILDLRTTLGSLSTLGLSVDSYVTVGGGSKSDAWMQVCADILGCPIQRTRVVESGTLGSAITAGVGSGVFVNYSEAVDAMVSMGDSFEPNAKNKAFYEQRFEQFTDLRERMMDFLHDLSSETYGKRS
jgi:xylulokinase